MEQWTYDYHKNYTIVLMGWFVIIYISLSMASTPSGPYSFQLYLMQLQDRRTSCFNRNLPLILRRVKNVMKGYRPPTPDGTSHHTFTHLILVYKLTKLYDVTQVTSRQIESLDEILLPPPPPSHECDNLCLLRLRDPSRAFQCDCWGSKLRIPPPSGPPVCPRVIARFMGILALDTPQQNNPCQSDVGSPSATEMHNK